MKLGYRVALVIVLLLDQQRLSAARSHDRPFLVAVRPAARASAARPRPSGRHPSDPASRRRQGGRDGTERYDGGSQARADGRPDRHAASSIASASGSTCSCATQQELCVVGSPEEPVPRAHRRLRSSGATRRHRARASTSGKNVASASSPSISRSRPSATASISSAYASPSFSAAAPTASSSSSPASRIRSAPRI